jgi:hypothetical protein
MTFKVDGYSITIVSESLFLNGSVFGDNNDSCYLAFIRQDQKGDYSTNQIDLTKTWIIGQQAFENRLVVFDM